MGQHTIAYPMHLFSGKNFAEMKEMVRLHVSCARSDDLVIRWFLHAHEIWVRPMRGECRDGSHLADLDVASFEALALFGLTASTGPGAGMSEEEVFILVWFENFR